MNYVPNNARIGNANTEPRGEWAHRVGILAHRESPTITASDICNAQNMDGVACITRRRWCGWHMWMLVPIRVSSTSAKTMAWLDEDAIMLVIYINSDEQYRGLLVMLNRLDPARCSNRSNKSRRFERSFIWHSGVSRFQCNSITFWRVASVNDEGKLIICW